MMNEHWSKLFILMTHRPYAMHTIEQLEPIERCAQVGFEWPIYMHTIDYPIAVRDWHVPTLGMDGVQ